MKIALVAHGDNPPYLKELFNGEGFELVEKECNNEKEYIDLLKDADGALIYLHPLTTKEVMEQCSNLKVISRGGVGVDSVDLEAATELGICICNTPGINTTEVADHAMAMLLSLTNGNLKYVFSAIPIKPSYLNTVTPSLTTDSFEIYSAGISVRVN